MKMSTSEIAAVRPPRQLIGAILIDAGILTDSDVKRVLGSLAKKSRRFGEVALELGLLTEDDLRFALSKQFEFAYLREADAGGEFDRALVTALEPFGSAAEPFRTIRSQLLLRWFDKGAGFNVLSVASHGAGEGRSYIAANLAVAFAQAGEITLLIDGDLRRSRQHEIFGLANRSGLSSYLAGQSQDEPICGIRALPGLFVMPAGPTPPNPSELFSRTSWTALLSQVGRAFDVVIIDTPPIETSDEALLITARAGASVLVARSDATRLGSFHQTVACLRNIGVEVVGSVLNELPEADLK